MKIKYVFVKKNLYYLLLLSPIFYALSSFFIYQNVNDPIKFIYTVTGYSSLLFLFATLLTNTSYIKKLFQSLKYRKSLGLISFFYALLHFLCFIVFDMELDLIFALEESFDKPFIYLGIIAFISLLYMAITSTKKLFKKHNKYHKVIYISSILILVHFYMSQKSLDYLDIGILISFISLIIYKMYNFFK